MASARVSSEPADELDHVGSGRFLASRVEQVKSIPGGKIERILKWRQRQLIRDQKSWLTLILGETLNQSRTHESRESK